MQESYRIGNGYDIHRLVDNRKLILGGIEIPFEKGLLGHSDADVLTHAIMDAMLGALSFGDIGCHFPSSNPEYKDISSLKLLEKVNNLVKNKNYSVANIDTVIIAEQPKLKEYVPVMKSALAEVLGVKTEKISVKSTTMEGLGVIGEGKGIAATAVVLLKKF